MKDITKGLVYAGIFAIPAIVLIISNTMFFPFITGKNFTFRIIVEIIFAGWVILALYEPLYRPKFSWILGSFSALLVVMFFANLFGESPQSSFWSNYERMEGYVTLVHTFLYMLIAGTVLTTEKVWDRFFMTTIGVAVVLSLYAFAQLSGNITINQGGVRLDGTLGNSAYMAIYMLFHIFITFFMLFRAKSKGARIVYGGLAVLFIYLLIQTATRGTILGLVGGSFIMATYIALFAREYPMFRKIATGGIVAIIAIVAIFITFKESSFIQGNPYLQRIATISLAEGGNRFNIWSMAFEGVKERPILGWGQGNYNYVFNEYYRPELHGGEAWFDRVHNIVMDWLIAGGVLGLIAYLSVLFSALYYLFFRPLFRKDDHAFTVVERGVLIGLLAGYFVHNIFVFDNIVSYIFYAVILAYIHARVALPSSALVKRKVDIRIVEQVVVPVVCILAFVVVYSVNVPGIQASKDIIKAFQTQDPEKMLQSFETALSRDSFGTQEIREQMTQKAQAVLSDEKIPEEIRQKFKTRVEEELLKQEAEKPGDARVEVFISSFYRATGNLEKAIEHLNTARKLSPKKQIIIFEQGFAYLQKQEPQKAMELFKEAYDLGPQFMESRVMYAMAATYAGNMAIVDELISTEEQKQAFANNDNALQAMHQVQQYGRLKEMLEIRIALKPTVSQERASLAYVLNDLMNDTAGAIEVLKKAGEDIPEFKAEADQYMQSIVSKNLGIKETAPVAPVPTE
ncbi:O-antigen ligase family protein [Candidatus Kaiserbacteria bacterium]|nr:MAG: O-antigen ligase family protein [Candidatus Kaiserbacteria bacterium]